MPGKIKEIGVVVEEMLENDPMLIQRLIRAGFNSLVFRRHSGYLERWAVPKDVVAEMKAADLELKDTGAAVYDDERRK